MNIIDLLGATATGLLVGYGFAKVAIKLNFRQPAIALTVICSGLSSLCIYMAFKTLLTH